MSYLVIKVCNLRFFWIGSGGLKKNGRTGSQKFSEIWNIYSLKMYIKLRLYYILMIFNQSIFEDGRLFPNKSWPVLPCDYGWEYNYSTYYPSLSSKVIKWDNYITWLKFRFLSRLEWILEVTRVKQVPKQGCDRSGSGRFFSL